MTFGEYVQTIKEAAISTVKGMGVTWKILWKVTNRGAVTIEYPESRDKVPVGLPGFTI